MRRYTLQNDHLCLSLDQRGRVVSLVNRRTETELITHPQAAEGWRMVLPGGGHTVAIIRGSDCRAAQIKLRRHGDAQSLVVRHVVRGVRATFVFELPDGADEITAHAELVSGGRAAVDELEFPVLGGLGGLPVRRGRRDLNLVAGGDRGDFYPQVLSLGLPNTGRESDHFVRAHETAMFEPAPPAGLWLDLWARRQGLFVGIRPPVRDFALKLEKFPKEVPNAPAQAYPPGTPRWLRVWAMHLPRLRPGGRWASRRVHIMPHKGDWHVAADRYAAWRHESLRPAEPPAWMDDFVGWTEILGKTYLGEVFHDYARCADAVVHDQRATGINVLFYYGHSRLGAEGADFDHSPSPDMGGSKGFRRMVEKLHARGIRIILLDHFHRWINRDLPEYRARRLRRHAVLDADGRPVTARWWKETFLSCRRLAGPTPVWVEMCPSSKKWLRLYLDHVTRMIELGVDGLELDTFLPSACHSRHHGHRPGADMFNLKLEFMRAVRAHAKSLNPDFALFGETMVPETREVLDGYYSNRYFDEAGRIHRYLFPEIRQQCVLVGNYAYDQVNKALSLGLGVDTEIWGLRKTAAEACPELARYIGEVNRLRWKHADVLIRGTFRDTVGAAVRGAVRFSVLQGREGKKALILTNPHPTPTTARASFRCRANLKVRLWRPFVGERALREPRIQLTLRPYEAAVLLAV